MSKKEKVQIHTIESAPEKSKSLLEASKKENGYIPNLHGVLAESPGLLETYLNTHKLFANSSFSQEEITVVWQTINVEHECHYCVPAHTAIAHHMKIDEEVTEALRNKTKMPTEKLQALHEMTLSITRNRGKVDQKELDKFYAAGFDQRNLFDIILGLSQKVISNYTNHIAETPLDKGFQKYEWKK